MAADADLGQLVTLAPAEEGAALERRPPASLRPGSVCGLLVACGSAAVTQSGGGVAIAGNLVVMDKGGKRAATGQAVIWLERTGAPPATPRRLEIPTRSKEFVPHVLVVPAGSTVAFPNHDPFSHNVFSVSEVAPFDLGLFERGQARTARFPP